MRQEGSRGTLIGSSTAPIMTFTTVSVLRILPLTIASAFSATSGVLAFRFRT